MKADNLPIPECAQNSLCERHISKYSVLREQVKTICSETGGLMTAVFESIEQTAQSYVDNMRHYYILLLEEMLPYIDEYCKDHFIVDCADHDFSFVEKLDNYLPWSEKTNMKKTSGKQKRICSNKFILFS